MVVDVYGRGPLWKKAEELISDYALEHQVLLHGRAAHARMLAHFAKADALVQTSVGFETQGMTVYESIAVGTPVFVADPKIAAELPAENVWLARTPSVDDMARALTRAAKDIRTGNSKRAIDTGDWSVLQSEITAKMIAIYAKAIAEGPKA